MVYAQQVSNSAARDLPNQAFVSIDQLQDIKGVDTEVLAALRPYITIVPYYLPINIKTISPVLLASLVEGASSQQMQTVTDLREKQVFETIDELWPLPVFSGLNQEQKKALTPLLAVDNQAFTALITAADNADIGQVRQRFATVMISKVATEHIESSGSNAADEDNKKPKEVRVVSQRLWAFRPVL